MRCDLLFGKITLYFSNEKKHRVLGPTSPRPSSEKSLFSVIRIKVNISPRNNIKIRVQQKEEDRVKRRPKQFQLKNKKGVIKEGKLNHTKEHLAR